MDLFSNTKEGKIILDIIEIFLLFKSYNNNVISIMLLDHNKRIELQWFVFPSDKVIKKINKFCKVTFGLNVEHYIEVIKT
jgi:hypothetical protein